MKFVYFDYGGSHSSVLAANIHAGNINKAMIPSSLELMNLSYFDKTENKDFAKLHFAGIDDTGNEIYFMGTKHSNFETTIKGLAILLGVSQEYVFVSTMGYVNPILRIGGFLSRGLLKPTLGRPLVFRGARMAFPALVNLVERVKVQSI